MSGLVFVCGFGAGSASNDEERHEIRNWLISDHFDCLDELIDDDDAFCCCARSDTIAVVDVVLFSLEILLDKPIINDSASLISSTDNSESIHGSK